MGLGQKSLPVFFKRQDGLLCTVDDLPLSRIKTRGRNNGGQQDQSEDPRQTGTQARPGVHHSIISPRKAARLFDGALS